MYTTSGEAVGLSVNTVPAFLTKLWTLVDDAATDELICWDASGMSFHVLDQARFAKEILPLYFKHNNIASFIRQLNMYGFRKITSTEAANVKMEKDDMEFAHRYFVKDQDQLLEFIKRKVPTSKTTSGLGTNIEDVLSKPDEVRHVLLEVNAVKGRQDNLTSKLENLKLENDVLWREVANLRQMHMKQQQVVSKLIQFLVTLVGNKRPLVAGVKRKVPLMLGDSEILANKLKRESSPANLPEKIYLVQSPVSSPLTIKNQSAGSIVIDDVTDLISTTIAGADVSTTPAMNKIDDVLEPLAILQDEYPATLELTDVLEDSSDAGVVTSLSVDDILSPSSGLPTEELSSSQENTTRTVAVADSIKIPRHEIANHLDMTATHLAGLRDLLASSPQINIDSNLMLELFNFNMDTLPKCVEDYHCDEEEWRRTIESMLPTADEGRLDTGGSIVGSELIQYTPAAGEDFSTLYDDDIGEPYHYLVDDESTEYVATSALNAVVPDDLCLSTPRPYIEEKLNLQIEDVMEDVD